ncbi:MAG: hypothetical protein ACJ8C4_16430 [Gemmataceae bacterium]
MPTFVTVREAAERTGKSPSSIRRIIYPIIQNEGHADRKHIQPSVEEALQLRMKGETFAWRVSEELLRREVPETVNTERGTGKPAGAHANEELLAMLRGELEIKNRQINQQSELISKQMELISGLSERLREGNILLGGLQQKLALTDGRDPKPVEPTKVKTVTPKTAKGTTTSAKAKKSFLSRLFR